ncbi:MAG: hypothetical protein KAU31_10655, partial [Spirochaetaceae bacterium]|nr:hypothetical protein [Spirochaetaceae bacterium]
PLVANYILQSKFIGGVWAAIVVGLIASFVGGLVDTFFMTTIPDLLPIGRVVDAGPPLILAAVATILFALVSRSNGS